MSDLSSIAASIPPPDPQSPEQTAALKAIDKDHAHTLQKWIMSPNIASETDEDGHFYLSEGELSGYGQRVLREYEIDDASRAEWKDKYRKWMNFALQNTQPKMYPWPNASNVIYPLLTTSAVQFAARAYPAIIQNRNVVKGVVVGDDQDGANRDRSDRIGAFMSWQLLDEMQDWETDTYRLLMTLPIVGCIFRKTYFDPTFQKNVSETVSADRVCINYHTHGFERAPRVTEEVWLYPIEIEQNIRSGIFVDQNYIIGASDSPDHDPADEDAPVMFLEQHRRLDLDDDGYAEPYIVTVERSSGRVARIVANYDMANVIFGPDGEIRRIDPIQYYTKFDFLPNPDGGIYGMGFGHLLYPINEAINATLNQMIDAGHLANTSGGFVAKGVSMNAGTLRWTMGEYKPVNVAGGALKDSIVPLQFPGPSPVLFQLLGFLVEAGKEVSALKDILMGNQPANSNVPATTVLALIEQGMQVFSSIYKSIHRSLKQEYNKLYRLNRLYLDKTTKYRVNGAWKEIASGDFSDGAGVEPVSDPTMVSDMQRLGRANFLMQFANDPLMNQMEIRRRILDAAQIDKPESLLNTAPPKPDPNMLLEQQSLQIDQAKMQATAMKDYTEARRRADRDRYENLRDSSTAYLNLANAQKAVGDTHASWIDTKLKMMEADIDANTSDDDPGPGSPGSDQPPQGANPAAMGAVASPPGQQGIPALPGGLPPGATG